ncbi:hypothetical protein PHMEG_00017280 [Phytophthora megakarya]|uniref:Uncharacterized protein n=1 Tax=Phytophthora megakarya TaxID=4795 RepID=A0A225VYS3_9STRA|nr:hypothetical protein PHMEG_00017280 [Phytophthora megakarya]
MLIKNEMYGPTSTVRLLSQDKTYSLLNKWAADKQSVDQVTVWLRSVGSKQQVPRKTIDGLVGKYKNIVSTPIKKSRLAEYDELYNDVLKEVNARKIYKTKLVEQGKSVAYVEREISELTTHLAKLQNLKIAEKRSPSKNLIGTPVRKSRLSELEELHADVIKEVNAKKDYMTKLTTLGKPEKAASVNDEISTLTDHLKSIGSAIEKEKISPSS